MIFSLQPELENEQVLLAPLLESEFEELYAVASDPKIWEQHPTKDRWKKEVFQTYFDGAVESKGALKIINKKSGEVAGCTRFYGYDEQDKSVMIGYTFYAVRFWGKGLNGSVKRLMLDYAFRYVAKVYFQIGATNYRSQIAITRLGAVKVGEESVAYHGEQANPNFVYEISRENWVRKEIG